METSTPQCIEINPSKTAVGSVIWLHGLGADGSDFVPLVPELKLPASLPIRFIFPNAPMLPVTVNNGYVMPAWFDIYGMGMDQKIDQAGILKSADYLESLIKKEEERGIPANKIVLAGFSQGAVIAMTAGLRYPKHLGGVLALSGYLPLTDKILAESSPANRTTPFFIAHGTSDTVVPYFLGQHTYNVLQKNNYPASFHSYPMAHSVCGEEIVDISEWLKKIFNA